MTLRNAQGGTIAFMLVTLFVGLIAGIGGFFMLKLVGGHRELSNAADSGTLGIAKDGVEIPTVAFTDAEIRTSPFGGLVDARTKGINLQTYNRAAGQAFLVALNAESDGKPLGIANARKLLNTLQGPNGIAARLSTKLAQPGSSSDSWVATAFVPPAASNSLRMLADNSNTPELKYAVGSSNYGVSYVHPEKSQLDESNSNIELNKNFNKQIPHIDLKNDIRYDLPPNVIAHDKVNGYRSLRGYDPMKLGKVGTLLAVTMSPFEQPHLISSRYFTAGKTTPSPSADLHVPPNSFQTEVAVADQRSSLNLGVKSESMVGTSAINIPLSGSNPMQLAAATPKYDLAIPRGYLIIDNAGNGFDSSYTGLLPQESTRSAMWYGTTGVSVDAKGSGFFSNNGRLEEWMKYNDAKNKGVAGLMPEPQIDGLYNKSGKPVSLSEARLSISASANPAPCRCHDLNSDPIAANPNPVCVTYARSVLFNPGPFDTAYFPTYLNPPAYGKAGLPMTAGELAKMKLWNLFLSNAGVGGMLTGVNHTTGARVYPQAPFFPLNDPLFGQPVPYNSAPGMNFTLGTNCTPAGLAYSSKFVPGQVTKEGTLLELMNQVASHDPNPLHHKGRLELKRFLENRMWQIKPDASQSEIDSIIDGQIHGIAVGKKYYLYLGKNREFKLDTLPPFWMDPVSGETPDGSPHDYGTIPFSVLGTLVNTPGDFNVHAIPFQESSGPTVFDRLQASFTPSSGANNLLGVVKFSETTVGAPIMFMNAN